MYNKNSTVFDRLQPNQDLYLIKYSAHPHPKFERVKLISVVNGSVEIKNNKDKIKTIKLVKARYRLFLDHAEMVAALNKCFIKRNMNIFESDYSDVAVSALEKKPELWI